MRKNIGNLDRLIRFTIALLLFGIIANNPTGGLLNYGILAMASIIVVTGLTGSCPVYNLLSISTRGTNSKV